MTCFSASSIEELGQSMVDGFDQRMSSIPQDLCAPFHMEARQVEAELITIYKMVVLCVRQSEDVNQIAEFWKLMISVCDTVIVRLSKLVAAHPHCGADCYYDRVLDLRNKCKRLHEMHS
jgi:hypothetical protein